MTDAYDDAVAHFARIAQTTPTNYAHELREAWSYPTATFGGCLFDYTGWYVDDGAYYTDHVSVGRIARWCGCLTQVKQRKSAFGPLEIGHEGGADLLDRLMHDNRIPSACPGADPLTHTAGAHLSVDDLRAFAGYQREVDDLLGRKPPCWNAEIGHYTR